MNINGGDQMDDFKDYLSKTSDKDQRARTTEVLNWVHS